MEDVSRSILRRRRNPRRTCSFQGATSTVNTGNGDAAQADEKDKDEENAENKTKSATKKKKKEIDLPITPRVPGATKVEMNRLIEEEVRETLDLPQDPHCFGLFSWE